MCTHLVSFYSASPTLRWSGQIAYVDTPGSRQLAMSLGDPWTRLWCAGQLPGSAVALAQLRGIPAIALQIGDGRGQLPAQIDADGSVIVRGLINMMRRLEIIDGPWQPPVGWHLVGQTPVRSTRWGLLVPEDGTVIGGPVRAGQVLYRLWNMYGDEVEVIVSPSHGTLAAARTFPCVQPGQLVGFVSEDLETISA